MWEEFNLWPLDSIICKRKAEKAWGESTESRCREGGRRERWLCANLYT